MNQKIQSPTNDPGPKKHKERSKKICGTFIALTINAIPPQADGDDIDVPFINIRRWRVHVGTGATAPPGALIQTPRSPSAVGPRLDLHIMHN